MRRPLLLPLGRLKRWPVLAALVMTVSLPLFFQNCGKAGMDHGEDLSGLGVDTPEMKKFKAAPFPFSVNVNQVALMTCPMASTSFTVGEDVEQPFFTFRVGAFDNRPLAARYPALFSSVAGMSAAEKSARLNAGVGLSADFMTYMQTQFGSRLANMTKAEDRQRLYRDAIVNSTHNYKLSSGLVLLRRNGSNGFAWDDKHAKGILHNLTDANVANQLSMQADLGAPYGTEKIHELTGVDIPQRQFISSISVPKSELERDQFRDNIQNYEFVVGYTKPEFEGDVFSLASPTDDNFNTLYGRTYRINGGSAWDARIDREVSGGGTVELATPNSATPEFIGSLNEYDTSVKGNPRNITTDDGQQWSCFSMMIVREADRRDPLTNQILSPGEYDDDIGLRDCALWADTPIQCSKKLKFYDFQAAATTPTVPAVKTACPVQEVGDSQRYGSINNNTDNGLARLRLEVARRFLPAEHWDVNTHPEYMCAVPKPSTRGFGNCYKSGDFNASNFILYTQAAQETVNGQTKHITCGINQYTGQVQKECPAFVSICYRTR